MQNLIENFSQKYLAVIEKGCNFALAIEKRTATETNDCDRQNKVR